MKKLFPITTLSLLIATLSFGVALNGVHPVQATQMHTMSNTTRSLYQADLNGTSPLIMAHKQWHITYACDGGPGVLKVTDRYGHTLKSVNVRCDNSQHVIPGVLTPSFGISTNRMISLDVR